MRKGFQLATLAGALTIAMSGGASAANLVFDGWTVNNGQIDETSAGSVCTQANVSCSVVASGDGFKQINVTDSTDPVGESYIMTIVTDQTATGGPGDTALGFYDVSFVKMKLTLGGNNTGTNANGIKAHQEIREGATGTLFTSTSDINTGWSVADAPVAITQTLTDEGQANLAGDDFASGFIYRSKNDATTGARTGFEMNIDQVAGLASGDNASVNDIQVFALREKAGTMLVGNADSMDLGAAGNPVTWTGSGTALGAAGAEDIKAIWIGQEINLDSTTTNNGSLGSTFGYLSFEDVASTTKHVESEFGFGAANAQGAWDWATAFNMVKDPNDPNSPTLGTPCLADPAGLIDAADPTKTLCTQLP